MKTAVSIPDDTFHDAEAVAQRLGWSRSQLYARAIREFVDAYADDPVTQALNELADQAPPERPPLTPARAWIESGEWKW